MYKKALACHTVGQDSNPDTTKVYSAPILSGTPAMCTLSLTMPVVTCSSVNTCHGGGRKRGILVKILISPSVRHNTDIRAMHGRKGVKAFREKHPAIFLTVMFQLSAFLRKSEWPSFFDLNALCDRIVPTPTPPTPTPPTPTQTSPLKLTPAPTPTSTST